MGDDGGSADNGDDREVVHWGAHKLTISTVTASAIDDGQPWEWLISAHDNNQTWGR
jgi:hypothetical protein